jgi:hypothetical protein
MLDLILLALLASVLLLTLLRHLFRVGASLVLVGAALVGAALGISALVGVWYPDLTMLVAFPIWGW